MHRIYLLIFVLFNPALAQIEADFSGYLLDLPIYQKNRLELPGSKQDVLLNLTRLRLRPTVYFGGNSRIALEWEITTLLQNAPALIASTPDKTNRQTFDWRWYPVQKEHITVSHFIDRLYFRQDFRFGNLTIGRQRVSWGTGRIWNPTDLFNPINPASYFKIEKDGADLAAAQVYLGNFTDLTLVVNPQENLPDNNGAFRFRSNYKTYDFSLLGGYFDKRYVIGGDFAGNFFTAGVRGEGIVSADRNDLKSNYAKLILGMDYQFTGKLYALIEYQHNGQGTGNKAEYDLDALLTGEIINLAQNYIFLSASYQMNPLLNSMFSYNGNLDDHSGFVTLTATYSLKSNLDLGLGAQLTFGSEFSEYWYYGNSLYLQGTFYF